MPKRSVRSTVKEMDDIAKIVTGRRLMELGSLFVSMLRNDNPVDSDNPYSILGILPTESERVIKFAFRAAAFEYHPDTGSHPDPEKFKKAKEAYDKIMKERSGRVG